MDDGDATLAKLMLGPVGVQAFDAACSLAVSSTFMALLEEFRSGQDGEASIDGWLIVLSSALPECYFGMTLSAERGFVLGKAALRSEAELHKTLLQELYRLCAGQNASGTVSGSVAAQTREAADFVERASQIMPTAIRSRLAARQPPAPD